jgi:hypothetical protein
MNPGNQNATVGYLLSEVEKAAFSATVDHLLSQVEKAAFSATEFATSFNNFIADGPSSSQSLIIKTVTTFSSAISDVLFNVKGVLRFIPDEKKSDALLAASRLAADTSIKFFQNLQSFRLDHLSSEQKADVVISNNLGVQANLQKLTKLTEQYIGKDAKLSDVKDLSEHVDNELSKAAAAIEAATARLAQLQKKSKDPGFSTYELQIHEYVHSTLILQPHMILLAEQLDS